MNSDRHLCDKDLRALLDRVAHGDKAAFRALYHALYAPLSRHLYRLIRCVDDVEELLNDVMWVVWKNAGAFRGDARVRTWVLGIATLKSRHWWQRQQRRQDLLAGQEWHAGAASAQATADERDLTRGLAQLPDEQRETIELAYYFGYSCEEIAQLMDCPTGTVKTRLHHARRRLRKILKPPSFSCGNAP